MSYEEFDKVVNILIEKKILEKITGQSTELSRIGKVGDIFLIAGGLSRIEPVFENDSLKQLELIDGNYIYDIYKEKYHLPALIEKNSTRVKVVRSNKGYSPTTYIDNLGNGLEETPDFLKDKSSESTIAREYEKVTYKNKVLPESPIVIEKKDNVIIIKQSFNKTEIVGYSLEPTISTIIKGSNI